MGWVLLIVLLGGPTSGCCCKPAKAVINVVGRNAGTFEISE
jgi:hypothetical protein